MPKIVCIIQARMGSTRLPGKVLKLLQGKPLLWWDMYRIKQSRFVDEIVIATTTQPQDDPLAAPGETEGWQVFRGSEDDVLDRYYQAAERYRADIVVRITSDCPLIDPTMIDYTITAFLSAAPSVDYAANILVRRYPRGLDVEVFSAEALGRAWREDHSAWREHVTPYIYNNPSAFRLLAVQNPVDYSQHRWTVDTPEDFELVRRIYEHFGHGDFRWQDVLDLLAQHPDWVALNAHVEQKKL